MAEGCVWQGGVRGRGTCMVAGMHSGGRGGAWQERWPLQRAVRILLECILVLNLYSQNEFSFTLTRFSKSHR